MYEDLIGRMRNWAASFCGCCRKSNKTQKVCDDCNAVYGDLWRAADAIEELQAGGKKFLRNISALEMENENLKRARRWIPVEERLPDDFGYDVLVTDGEDYAVGFWREDAKAWDSADFGWLENRSEHPCGIHTVTHWMPLPPAPEPPQDE